MSRNPLPQQLLCASLLIMLGQAPAEAAKPAGPPIQSASCPAELPDPRAPVPTSSFGPAEARDGKVHIVADEADAQMGESATFRGNVEFLRNDLRLFADEATYSQRHNNLSASGHLFFQRDGGETLRAPSLQYDLNTDRIRADQAKFSILEPKARGEAKRFFVDSRNVLHFESVRFTTCPPGRDDWFLRTSRLTLDKNTETGTARHAVFEFSAFGLPHVPIFYTPYLSFPLTNEPRSGFLAPHIGDTSKSGFFIAAPYYFYLAPNYDLTFTPHYMSKRGVQWSGDFRYLGQGLDGRFLVEYLPNDQGTGTDREKLIFLHNQRLSPTWSTTADIEWVSDNNYFIDLGSTAGLSSSSRTHLPRSLRFDYGGEVWRFMARGSTFQTIDANIGLAEQPYQRLPQLVLSADLPSGPNRLHYSFYSEWVNFYRSGLTGATVPLPDRVYSPYGQRVDVFPNISLPWRTPYFYFTPKVGYRHTTWRLDHNEQGQSVGTELITLPDATPTRGLPVYSLDSGLTFERDSRWGSNTLTQTLEPRLFYVRIPYRDQDQLPLFDSAIPDFNFYNFFRENRFVGADRVGDANQFTAAVTSRFLSQDSGTELVRISLGQLKSLDDQRVNWPVLPAGTTTPATSDLIGELYARLGEPWYLRSALQWDDKRHETRKANLYLTYRPASDRTINLGFRYLDTPLSTTENDRQFDLSSQWPLTPAWTGFARWNYSVQDQRSIFAYLGVEYSNCCWGVRLGARHRIHSDGSQENSMHFQLMLGGISTSYDRDPDSPLKVNRFIFD